MINNFELGFRRDYGVDLQAGVLASLCQVDWPSQIKDWPGDGSFDVTLIDKVHISVTSGEHPHWDQFPYF